MINKVDNKKNVINLIFFSKINEVYLDFGQYSCIIRL